MAAQDTLLNGRYRLIQQHASGGMAVVYKAQDLALGRFVAIKILRPSLTGDPSFLTRFRQEARNVANLSHPNIVTLYDVGQDGNTYYMVMEFIDGQDLKKLIRAQAPFSIERALHIAIQVCAGIGYAHRAELVHADVKPQNILITGNDTVKVTDFGIAQALAHTQPQQKQSVVWGSPHYFAPEQASGDQPTPASDVYSIGIVLFEMLTGKLPYVGADQQELALAHIREQIPHVMDVNPQIPVHLDRIIYKVMAKEPTARYRTADQLGRILIGYQKQGQELTSNVPPASPPQPPQSGPLSQQPSVQQAAQRPPTPQPINQRPNVPVPGVPAQQAPHQQQPQAPVYGPPTPQINNQHQNVAPAAGHYAQSPVRPGTGPNSAQNPQGQADPYSRQAAANPFRQAAAPPQANPNQFRPNTGPMQPGSTGNTGSRPSPNYEIPPQSGTFDIVSIILACVAFLLILGLFPLWLAVLGAWLK